MGRGQAGGADGNNLRFIRDRGIRGRGIRYKKGIGNKE